MGNLVRQIKISVKLPENNHPGINMTFLVDSPRPSCPYKQQKVIASKKNSYAQWHNFHYSIIMHTILYNKGNTASLNISLPNEKRAVHKYTLSDILVLFPLLMLLYC